MNNVYLDHNATTVMLTEVKEEMLNIFGMPLNPSSTHNFGRRAKSLIESARDSILTSVGVSRDTHDLIFTATATEANNLVIENYADAHIIISTTEHASMRSAASNKQNVSYINVDSQGIIDLLELEAVLAKSGFSKKIVSVILANNETGVLQSLPQITKVAHRYGAVIHSDAVQGYGRMEINMSEVEVDLMTIASHKCGGPVGAAALIYKKSLINKPLIVGGGQERRLRSGTENVFAIVGFGKIASLLKMVINRFAMLQNLRDQLETMILEIDPRVIIFGRDVVRLQNTSCFTMPGVSSEAQLINFDLAGFAVSAGSACSSGKVEVSTVLKAMGASDEVANTAIRVSFGLNNNIDDVKAFVVAWKKIYKRLVTSVSNEDQLVQRAFATGLDNNNYIH